VLNYTNSSQFYKVEVKSGVKCTFKSGCTLYLFFGMLWVDAKVLKAGVDSHLWMLESS